MAKIRTPFQGVLNIIRFNWPFYITAIILVPFLFYSAKLFDRPIQSIIHIICFTILVSIVLSLLASFYIYDFSGLYDLKWVDQQYTEKTIININAGFDETSYLLRHKFKDAELISLDFYDQAKHTEASIKRARKAYPPFHGSIHTSAIDLKLADNSADKIFVILAAHEVRNEIERVNFFKELCRVIKPSGQIYITEHLRDLPNFVVYNIGFFHFFSKSTWLKTFMHANLKIADEIKLTPFISTFILNKNGNTL